MINLFIDATKFRFKQEICQALRMYLINNTNLKIVVLGHKNDFATLLDNKSFKLVDDLTPLNELNQSEEMQELNKNKEKKDYNKKIREELEKEADIVLTSKDFSSFGAHTDSTIIRPYNKEKGVNPYFVELPKTTSPNEIKNIVKDVIKIFNNKLNKERKLKIFSVKPYSEEESLSKTLDFFSEYNGEIEIQNSLDSDFDILVLDNLSSYYFYNIISSLSDDNKRAEEDKEKGEKLKKKSWIGRILSFDKPRSIDTVNADSLFSYYIIELKDNKYTVYLRNYCNVNSFFAIFDLISKLGSK